MGVEEKLNEMSPKGTMMLDMTEDYLRKAIGVQV